MEEPATLHSVFPTINQQQSQCDEIAKVILAGKASPEHISGLEGLKI